MSHATTSARSITNAEVKSFYVCDHCGQLLPTSPVITSDGYFCNGICAAAAFWNAEETEEENELNHFFKH